MPDRSTIEVLAVGKRLAPERTVSEGHDDRLSVTATESVDAACERLCEPVDCVVVQRDLPDGDWRDVLAESRRIDPDRPVVVVVEDPAAGEATLESGATEFVIARGDVPWRTLATRISHVVDARQPPESGPKIGGSPDTESGRELREMNAIYEQILENTATSVWLATADLSEVLYVNAAHYQWMDDPERLASDPLSYHSNYHPEDVERDRETVEKMREWAETGDAPDELKEEFRLFDVDGDMRWIEERTFPIHDDGGNVSRWAGVVTDITERKERENELKRQNERLTQFAKIVSHDLRNPLHVAVGRVDLVRERHDSDELAEVANALDRMAELIDDILTIAREGTRVDDRQSVDLATATRAAWRTTETADAKLHLPDDLGQIQGDPARIQRLLENLFRNAVEHGSTSHRTTSDDAVEHGSTNRQQRSNHVLQYGSKPDRRGGQPVTVRVGRVERGFFVEDNGPGIPPEQRASVFESGYTTEDSGTGFGLTIVAEIAAAHGWTVTVTDGRDGGARFEIVDADAPTTFDHSLGE